MKRRSSHLISTPAHHTSFLSQEGLSCDFTVYQQSFHCVAYSRVLHLCIHSRYQWLLHVCNLSTYTWQIPEEWPRTGIRVCPGYISRTHLSPWNYEVNIIVKFEHLHNLFPCLHEGKSAARHTPCTLNGIQQERPKIVLWSERFAASF